MVFNDGGVTGSSAALRHDRSRDFHHRLPIGARRFRNENLARPERRQFTRIGNDTHGSECDFLPDRSTGHQRGSRSLEGVGLKAGWRSARGRGLRSRLNDVNLLIIGVLGPLNVHRHRMPSVR